MIASAREKVLVMALERDVSRMRTIRAVEIRSKSGNSFDTVSFLTLMGRMTAVMPMSSSTLTMLLPMTLPIRISVLPPMSEEKDTASSGAPVPKATIVRPIRSLLTLKFEATDEAPSTSQSAPLIRSTKPIRSKIACKNNSMLMVIIPQII